MCKRLFKDGNPIIYGGAIKSVEGNPKPGQEVEIFDHQGNLFARGFFNPHSQYRVRVLAQKKESRVFNLGLEGVFKYRIEAAKQLR